MASNGIYQRKFSSSRKPGKSNHNQSNNGSDLTKIKISDVMGKNKQSRIRFIQKSGRCNVSHENLKDKPRRFLADIFTTGVDLQWRYNLLVFSAAFVLSWLIFGLIYWAESYRHGDFDPVLLNDTDTFKACIEKLDVAYPFTSTFLFSLETQTTIGYGYRHVTEECWITVTIVVLQSVFGCILDAFMIGLIMAKISRPKKRAETLLFSRHAVISIRDKRLCFMVRVGNLRKSHLVEATIRMQYVHSRHTLEGEYIPLEQLDLNLDLRNDSDRLFLVTPQTICHPIDKDSPLWDLREKDLEHAEFEIIVILEGMVEATGMTTQARASYLPSEILWNHRFQNMISLSRNNAYKVNFKKFHDTYRSSDSIQLSAKEMYEAEKSRQTAMDAQETNRSKKTRSESSSSSSTTSRQPFGVIDEKTWGYAALNEHSESKIPLSITTTSTSSQSDDSATPPEHKVVDDVVSNKSTSSSLIDLSSPKLAESDCAITGEERRWEGPQQTAAHSALQQANIEMKNAADNFINLSTAQPPVHVNAPGTCIEATSDNLDIGIDKNNSPLRA